MLPEKAEPTTPAVERRLDPFMELRDHANLWDVTALLKAAKASADEKPEAEEPGPAAE